MSYYVDSYSCHGIAVHESNYGTSRRQQRFHTISLQNILQIISVISVELAKSLDCFFPVLSLRFKKFHSVVKYNSNQEISTILSQTVPYLAPNMLYKFHPRIIEGF